MTKQFFKGLALSGAMFGMLCGVPAIAQTAAAPDNTKMNKGDASKAAVTADQAKNNKSDREIMAEIRRSIVADKGLSTYAHNIKIVAQHGQVTLKGPVHSEDERKTIEAKAADVAGADHITNQITVKEERSSK
jgi:hyperosmotically inducible protein